MFQIDEQLYDYEKNIFCSTEIAGLRNVKSFLVRRNKSEIKIREF